MLAVIMIAPMCLFAQGGDTGTIEPGTWFLTLGGFVAAVMAVTEFLKKYLFKTSGFASRFLSWIVAVALAFAGWFLQFGIFAGLQWYWALLYALAAGLAGNGIFDIGIISGLLSLVNKKGK